MKKLMIAAAIVCAAAAVQAAAFTWSSSVIYMPTSIANITEGDNQAAKTSGTLYKITKWTQGGVAFTYTMIIDGNQSSGDMAFTGASGANVSANNAGFVIPTDESTKTINYSIVISGTYTTDEGTYDITSSAITGSAVLTKLSTTNLSTSTPSSWSISFTPAPEPTSAMLMLLGMAGLALKRRRA